MKFIQQYIKKIIAFTIVWLASGLYLGSVGAVTQEISAVFRPDPAKPHQNTFINQTPESGYCASYPGECRNQNMFSIRLPIRFEARSAIQPNHGPRQGATFKVPASWRALSVRNLATNEEESVEVRIVGLGSEYVLSDTAANLVGGAPSAVVGHQQLWGGSSWVYAPAPCLYSGVGFYGDSTYMFFWKTPIESSCEKPARYLIPGMSYTYLDFAYELRTPNPLGMSSGTYTGTLNYKVGPGLDFDMGDMMLPNDSVITLDFKLDVQHTLKVDIPPGGHRIELIPQGGWQAWLQQGRKPVRLFRDQTFNISASSRFKMILECQIDLSEGCGIADPVSGYGGLVNVYVSLPNGLTDSSGQPVSRVLLSRDATGPFQPGFYVDRAPGTLHFEMPPKDVSWLILNAKGRAFMGNITVIWDSEV
ncbi:hypothetical protein [Pseudomonas fluorescens]|uniref:Fimbrial protein n=1 Tax=Pseudomonas fluorescens TaxID=294 RepID=A0A5E7CC06_PSEFL|nr:hypothetical protein [Pseudomonas fluorescens]VVO00018.1 hypothetical protein PS723_02562 [Pseudomonas fluorescens]